MATIDIHKSLEQTQKYLQEGKIHLARQEMKNVHQWIKITGRHPYWVGYPQATMFYGKLLTDVSFLDIQL